MYEYRATVNRVIDGDSLVMTVDLGWLVFLHDQKVRLFGIDCPERFTEAGKAAIAATVEWLAANENENGQVLLRTRKSYDPDKYGRWLAVVVGPGGTTLNDHLLATGHAVTRWTMAAEDPGDHQAFWL